MKPRERPVAMPSKQVSPLLGYNNNVRHRGKVFHIQTEDSGVKYGHIITHLFMDGGRILKSVKTSYAEYVGNDRMGELVREMMKQQHKAMFISLRDGKFDPVIDGSESVPPSTQTFVSTTAAARRLAPALDASTSESMAQPPLTPASTAVPPIAPPHPAAVEDDSPSAAGSADNLGLDIEAVERAAAAASLTSPALRPSDELPPPPANLLRERPVSTGKYRVTTPAPPTRPFGPAPSARAPSNPPVPAAASGGTRRPSAKPGGADRRYAPTRPASIFGQARPQPGAKSIFGDDLINDKSLDEVILSYLAEDVDGEEK